jgi:hypothetical protein
LRIEQEFVPHSGKAYTVYLFRHVDRRPGMRDGIADLECRQHRRPGHVVGHQNVEGQRRTLADDDRRRIELGAHDRLSSHSLLRICASDRQRK